MVTLLHHRKKHIAIIAVSLIGNFEKAPSEILLQVGLYKVEFRILEIRISGETNLKKHFLSGNWIRKKIFWAEKTVEFWISAEYSL